jgi:hypothetical protein
MLGRICTASSAQHTKASKVQMPVRYCCRSKGVKRSLYNLHCSSSSSSTCDAALGVPHLFSCCYAASALQRSHRLSEAQEAPQPESQMHHVCCGLRSVSADA